jgi:hypothetical protein
MRPSANRMRPSDKRMRPLGRCTRSSDKRMRPLGRRMRPSDRRMRPSTSVCAPPLAYAPLSQPYAPVATPTIQRGSDVAATVDKVSQDLPCPRSRRR